MGQTLVSEILRVITSPYGTSLINLDSALKAAGPHEIRAWADSHPCQIKALAKAAIESLQYCPYGLAVVEKLGVVPQLKDEMLALKPILIDMLMRNALQDDMNFEKYSPALIALLSNPLPPAFSPPAKLVVFFLKCLDKATKTPTISTIRPLFVLVANGYNRLSLQMSESQSYNFVKRMTGFMTDPGRADMNVFLTYCLATLAHMHLATVSAGGEPKTGEEKKPSAIGEFFQGRKAPNVLSLILNIVNALVSPETKVDWQEKVQIIRMATVIASALRVNGSTKEDAANLRRLLEKTKTQDGSRVVSEVLDFVSALRLIIPQPLLVSTIQELVRKDRKEESASMFLPVVSTGLFAKAASQDLIGDMLRSMLKRVLANNDPTRSLYLLLQDRLLFLQELDKVVPNSPNLRRGVLGALSTMEFSELVDVFVRHTITAPAPSDACGENEACRWFILNLTNKLQLALCTFILRCALFSQADADTKLFPEMAILLMGKLGNLSAAQPQCPFESTLKSTTSCDTLSLIEESASPEVRFSSRNWRQSLMNGLSRDSDRQHAFIVATVGEICRDLEHRCDNVEKPLRVEEENSQRLQEELDRLKAKFIEVEEQLVRCLHSLDHSAGEKEQLENKLDGALERSKETFGRIKELEQVIETESEGSRQAANLAAMEHMAALNTRQEMIDELQEHKRELEQETDDLQDAALHLKENKSRLEESVKTLQVLVAEAQTELRESKEEVEKLGVEKTKLQESLEAAEQDLTQVRVEKVKLEESLESVGQDLKEARIEKTKLQESLESADKGLTEVSAALEEHKLVVKEKLLDIDRQQKIIDEMVNENGRQKEEIGLLEGTRENMQEKILALEKTVEKAMQDGEQKCKTLSAKLISNHNQQLSKLKSEHDEEVDQLHVSHDTAIAQVHNKLEQTWKDWHKERDGLRAEIRALNEKLNNFRAIHEERQKEAQNLGRQLMSLMSGAGKPDLAGLLGGTMNSPSIDALSEQAPIYSDEITIPNGHPQGAIPVRRKSSEHNCDNEDDNPTHAKRAKTTHQSPTALARQGHIKLKVAKTPHRRSDGNLAKRKAGVEVDEMVKETPISPTETNYGTAPVLTSTPKGFLGQYGLGGRRKTMPLFPSTAVADDNDDENDIEEEEALRGAARDVAWDETTMD